MAKKDSNGNPIGKRFQNRRASGGIADWEQANAEILRKAIATAASSGGALRFGYSRDGGAYSVGIYVNGEMNTEWLKPDEDLDGFLSDIVEFYEDVKDEQAKGRSQKKAEK